MVVGEDRGAAILNSHAGPLIDIRVRDGFREKGFYSGGFQCRQTVENPQLEGIDGVVIRSSGGVEKFHFLRQSNHLGGRKFRGGGAGWPLALGGAGGQLRRIRCNAELCGLGG